MGSWNPISWKFVYKGNLTRGWTWNDDFQGEFKVVFYILLKYSLLWTYTNPNKSKELLDYILINKMQINTTLNCDAYSSFEGVSSNHWITAKIPMSLCRNKK